MELAQPETVGVLDHHDGCIRDVDPDLDDSGCHQYVQFPPPEGSHHRLLLLARKLAVQQPEPQPRKYGSQPVVFGRGRHCLDLGAVLDKGTNYERLPARGNLLADEIMGTLPLST